MAFDAKQFVLDTTLMQPSDHGNDTRETFSYYHAGPLFTIADLNNNVLLSREISKASNEKYLPVLPQDLEQRGNVTPQNIRDKDIRALLNCDLALFTYDGAELDSGTVVEFLIAKMADIPCVILRSDFRGGGDQASKDSPGQPWNLMSSFWPRTTSVVIDSMLWYKQALATVKETAHGGDPSRLAGEALINQTAMRCSEAMDEVLKIPAKMPKELREPVYRWLAMMPGFAEGEDQEEIEIMLALLAKKQQKGVLS